MCGHLVIGSPGIAKVSLVRHVDAASGAAQRLLCQGSPLSFVSLSAGPSGGLLDNTRSIRKQGLLLPLQRCLAMPFTTPLQARASGDPARLNKWVPAASIGRDFHCVAPVPARLVSSSVQSIILPPCTVTVHPLVATAHRAAAVMQHAPPGWVSQQAGRGGPTRKGRGHPVY